MPPTAANMETDRTLPLRCYAYGDGDGWGAICTDLDIAVDGPSLDDVKASLAACIELYLEGVAESPPEERPRLLARRSPWRLRAKLAGLAWLRGVLGPNGRPRGFVLRPHLPAAA